MTYQQPSFHAAIDLGNGRCGDPVLAAGGGKVVIAGIPRRALGAKVVRIDHGKGWQTEYGHLGTISVHVGQLVAGGEVLGTVGNTGRSSGCHLHFAVRKRVRGVWHWVDPWPLLPQNNAAPVEPVVDAPAATTPVR
jgi:murein DD-endopeptidase MepM/ murein hydrolase activator NlpD